MEWTLVYVPPVSLSRRRLNFPRSRSLLIFQIKFPMLFYITFVQGNLKWKAVTKNKMDNPRFIDEENISIVPDEDYDARYKQDR